MPDQFTVAPSLTFIQETTIKFMMEEYAHAFADLVDAEANDSSRVNECTAIVVEAQKDVIDYINALIK